MSGDSILSVDAIVLSVHFSADDASELAKYILKLSFP
jgi:hypothetical protein